jgi:hypothetical protein
MTRAELCYAKRSHRHLRRAHIGAKKLDEETRW